MKLVRLHKSLPLLILCGALASAQEPQTTTEAAEARGGQQKSR